MRTEVYIDNYKLDLTKDISAEFTYAIDEIQDFATRNTSFSKTIVLPGNDTNNNGVGISVVPQADTSDAYYQIFFNATGGGIGSIRRVGTTSAVAFNTSSDRRLKENILPANSASTLIDSIQVVQYDWKEGTHVRHGIIAQDLYSVAPEAVSIGDSEEIENPRNPWGVDYSKLVPMLIKEIQELRARIATLELGNN